MKFNRLSAFTLGVIITATSVGAVTYVNAAGDATLKACANKTTGAMRYISKGSCKKTEKLLSWNQMGPQGANGQNFHVIDAAGRDLGVALSSSATAANIMYEGGIWTLQNTGEIESPPIVGELDISSKFSDSSCVTPYWKAPSQFAGLIEMARGVRIISGTTKYYKPSGTPYLGSTSKFYSRQGSIVNGVRACVEITDSDQVAEFAATYFTNVVEVTPPPFTAPFTIVAK
jgi:hypothetical protein